MLWLYHTHSAFQRHLSGIRDQYTEAPVCTVIIVAPVTVMTALLLGIQQSMANIQRFKRFWTDKWIMSTMKKMFWDISIRKRKKTELYDKRRRKERKRAQRKGEWKCKDCMECSRVNCKWTPKPQSPPDKICSLPWHTATKGSQSAGRNAVWTSQLRL